ncbi:MAG: CPBP family intramembrane metalloprotease [Candidatus Dormibacteraeota bacterium]|nr:CPBP family intramembrane metalloprotease [Candidatus Dormibacteraeota bacterium]
MVANWNLSPPPGDAWAARTARALGSALWAALGAVALLSALLGAWAIVAPPPQRSLTYGLCVLGASALGTALLFRRAREIVARALPIDPDSGLDATALILVVILLGFLVGNQLSVDVLAEQARSGPSLQPIDVIGQELPFLLAAFLGVGLFTRRSLGAALDRLGLVRPTSWQVFLALAAAGLFLGFSSGIEVLSQILTPQLAEKVNNANQRLFGRLDDPMGIATIALAAGVCEETLFRGALQPRLGLVLTSIAFAAVHSQYGISLDVLAVFVLALCLGALRRLTNTTTAILAHVTYNALVGFGVAQRWLPLAVAGEAALILLAAGLFFTGRVGASRFAK